MLKIHSARFPIIQFLATPTGKLPLLEVDGKQLPESGAIFRYLAKQHGLAPKDDWENAQMESAVEYFKDFGVEVRPFFLVAMGRKEGDKEDLYKNSYIPAADKVYARIGDILSKTTSGFLANSGVSWGDFYVAEATETFKGVDAEFASRYPHMIEHHKKVYDLPQLQKYLQNRKPSAM